MKQGLILLLAACTLAAAMVPRDRRAVNTEEDEEMLKTETTTSNSHELCAPQTPCKWVLYNHFSHYSHYNMIIMNTYCECSKEQDCSSTVEDPTTEVFYCQNLADKKSNDS